LGLGFRGLGLGFGVWSSGLRVWGLEIKVRGSAFRVRVECENARFGKMEKRGLVKWGSGLEPD